MAYFVQCCLLAGCDLSKTAILIADVSEEESLNAMCSSAKIILNCVGPVKCSALYSN